MKLILLILLSLFVTTNVFAYPAECKGKEGEFAWELSKFKYRKLKGKTIFAGSSSIRMWKNTHKYFKTLESKNIYNRGFGGSQICHMLIHYKRLFVGESRYQNPDKIVLYSGDNDLGAGLSAEKIVEHYELLIEKIRKAGVDAPIYIITVKPSPKRLYIKDKIRKTGDLTKSELEKLDNVYVVHTFDWFFNKDGSIKEELYLDDQLHLKPRVYWHWAYFLEKIW